MRNAFTIATDLDNAAQELAGALPCWHADPWCGEEETPAEFRIRMATEKALRIMREAAKELRGEPEDENFRAQASFAFACGG